MVRWVIFNFYDGEFIRQNDMIVHFETKGLAHQFLENYRKPKPVKVTKETIYYDYYDAPFRLIRETIDEAI